MSWSWPMTTALKFRKFQTFLGRMDKVILALKGCQAWVKALFLDMVSTKKRLAMQPEEETKKKGTNKSNNSNRDVQLQFARSNMATAENAMQSASIHSMGLGGSASRPEGRHPQILLPFLFFFHPKLLKKYFEYLEGVAINADTDNDLPDDPVQYSSFRRF